MPAQLLDGDSLPHLDAAGAPRVDPQVSQGVLARTRLVGGRAEILPGLDVAWSIALDHRTCALEVAARGLTVWTATLAHGQACASWQGNQGLFKEDVTFCVDLGRGELTLTGDVCVRDGDAWRCHRFPTVVLAAFSPTLGAVGGDVLAHPPAVDDPAGASRSIVPTITRIPVDAVPRAGTPVGGMVKAALFADVPDFLFNVCFAVGPFELLRPGAYGDPTSPWFNVFAGYYQIDCPTPAWTRPFGYAAAAPGAAIAFDDILRIGKADWNYFSAWMYGTPLAAVTPYDPLDPGVACTVLPPVTIGGRRWDQVDVDGFGAASAYQAEGSTQLLDNTVLTPLWRATYGEPASVPGHPTSFPGTRMHARLYMAFRQDAEGFHTYLFGGTVNKAFDGPDNARVLDAQMAACAEVIAVHYPALGFPAA
jgi:hypothetical protein